MTAPNCDRPLTTCIEQLAGGWINPPDLCPSCTVAFMQALDGITGPLSWHPAYVKRAGSREEVTT